MNDRQKLRDYVEEIRELGDTFGSEQAAPLLVDHAYDMASALEVLLDWEAETASMSATQLGSPAYVAGYRNAQSDALEELRKVLDL